MSYQVLLDYDGVFTQKINFAREVSKRYGLHEAGISNFFNRHLQPCLRGKGDLIELLAGYVEEIGWESDAQSLFEALYLDTLTYNTGLINFIEGEIKGPAAVYLATNQDHHRLQLIRKDEMIQRLCDQVFGSSELGWAKPDPAYFEEIFHQLRKQNETLKKLQVLFVDDLPENIDAAESFGFDAHLFNELPDFKNYYRKAISGERFPQLAGHDLSLVKMKFSHAIGYSRILSEPGTYHFLTETGPVGEQQASQKIATNRNAFDQGRSIYWSIVGERGAFMGFLAVHAFQQPEVAVSFGIHPDFRRRGIATKALKLVLGWSKLQGRLIKMATHPENEASFRLLSKLDLIYEGLNQTDFGVRHVFRNK